MLDIQFIRENADIVKKATKDKGFDEGVIDRLLKVDIERRKLLGEVEGLRAKRNKLTKDDIEEGKKLKVELKEQEESLDQLQKDFEELMYKVPNLAADDVKEGKNETENEVVRKEGTPTKFSFKPKDHLNLGEKLGVIDTERASKVSGTRFGYLIGDGALLEMALVNFAFETLGKEGFTPIIPPVFIKTDSMRKMGYMEHGGDEQMYVFDKDGLVLVGTSEQSIGPMHMNEIIDVSKPVRYMGFSSCFRREAGSYGKDTRGILRVHQFDKVEMFSFTKSEDSEKEHEFLLNLEEKFLQKLGIPYQVVKMCSGDLGAPAARKYDLEAWIPSEEKYRELTSTSTCTDFQSRRLNIKYKDGDKSGYVHTLNGTVFAMGRTIIAILENFQNEDGSVNIPKVLQKWMGKEKIAKV